MHSVGTFAAVLVSSVLLTPLPPAVALDAIGGGVLAGSGTVSPGLGTQPHNQTVTFSGTFAGTVAAAASVSDQPLLECVFSGYSTVPETITVGQGAVNMDCRDPGAHPLGAPPRTDLACQLNYMRVGTEIELVGPCAVVITAPASGSAAGTLVGLLKWEPTNANLTTSYVLEGYIAIS